MKLRPLIVLAVIVLVIVGVAVWFLQSQPPVAAVPDFVPPAAPAVTAASPAPSRSKPVATPPPGRGSAAQGAPAARAMADWEVKIDEILRTNAGETETAQILINMLPTLPPEGQVEAAQHISNLIVDREYGRILPLLRNTSLPEEVQDVLITDLMNRENPVKLPALVEVAKLPQHPHHEEAVTDLQIFLDQDFGTDWNQWDSAVRAYVLREQQENPPEAAEPVITQ